MSESSARDNRPVYAPLTKVGALLTDQIPEKVVHKGLRPSAVLVLIYPKDSSYCVLLNKRTQIVEFNKGDICFPGGAKDSKDADFRATALRETEEEMGIDRKDITVIGELSETVVPSGFFIKPFVGTIPYPYQFKPSSQEVAEVLQVPLSVLYDPKTIREEMRVFEDGRVFKTIAYGYNRHLIYGATARILSQLLDIIAADDNLKKALST